MGINLGRVNHANFQHTRESENIVPRGDKTRRRDKKRLYRLCDVCVQILSSCIENTECSHATGRTPSV